MLVYEGRWEEGEGAVVGEEEGICDGMNYSWLKGRAEGCWQLFHFTRL